MIKSVNKSKYFVKIILMFRVFFIDFFLFSFYKEIGNKLCPVPLFVQCEGSICVPNGHGAKDLYNCFSLFWKSVR
jgi:hypothetical protein